MLLDHHHHHATDNQEQDEAEGGELQHSLLQKLRIELFRQVGDGHRRRRR